MIIIYSTVKPEPPRLRLRTLTLHLPNGRQWQAMGYDTHSDVINPNFIDFPNFVQPAPLYYGLI